MTTIADVLNLNAKKLKAIAFDEWVPRYANNDDFSLLPIQVKLLRGNINRGESNCYIVQKKRIGSCIVIDPGVRLNMLLDFLEKEKLTLKAILISHTHFDHITSLNELASGNCPVFVGEKESIDHFSEPVLKNVKFVNNTNINLLEETLTVLSTPGHTRGGLSFVIRSFVFVGDLMFAGSIGRSLNATFYSTHLESAKRILNMPEDTYICPGHGPVTTVTEELNHNPFF